MYLQQLQRAAEERRGASPDSRARHRHVGAAELAEQPRARAAVVVVVVVGLRLPRRVSPPVRVHLHQYR
jgi:hypothetical protein